MGLERVLAVLGVCSDEGGMSEGNCQKVSKSAKLLITKVAIFGLPQRSAKNMKIQVNLWV